jgi:plastocyanin
MGAGGSCTEARALPGTWVWAVAFVCALAALLFAAPGARAGVSAENVSALGYDPGKVDGCPTVPDKPGAVDHVNYQGMQHVTYCYGPITIQPGQNIIRLRDAVDPSGTKLWPQVPGYITRFDPDLVYAGTDPGTTPGQVPGVDVLHLHHAVWLVNGPLNSCSGCGPQFAAGEEKTIAQLPHGFGYRSLPSDDWQLNDMLHELIDRPAHVYVIWRIDFVPDSSPDAASMKTVHTQWMDVGGPSFYPVFDALRSMDRDHDGRYTFPDDATNNELNNVRCFFKAADKLCPWQSWTANQDVTLIGTAGHLHPGGLNTQLKVTRPGQGTNTIFTSKAHYYEPAGEVSWDVSMGATNSGDGPNDWRVKLKAGDKLSVHATYDTSRADWYEVMGISPVAVYNGSDVGGFDAMSPDIPQNDVLTHTHLRENDNHGGLPTGAPDPFALPSAAAPNNMIAIQGFSYVGDPNASWAVPTVNPGQSLTFKNYDAVPSVNAFHTITACKAPCTGSTGIAYPIANAPVSFDSSELGFNGNNGSLKGFGPAADRDTWKAPSDLPPGTYTYFCRIHPFMRGAFRVAATPSNEFGFGKVTRNRRNGTATVALHVPAAGTLETAGKGVSARWTGRTTGASASTTTVSAPGSVKLKLKAKGNARLKLNNTGRARLRLTVTYTPSDLRVGPNTKSKRIKLVKRLR